MQEYASQSALQWQYRLTSGETIRMKHQWILRTAAILLPLCLGAQSLKEFEKRGADIGILAADKLFSSLDNCHLRTEPPHRLRQL